MKLFTAVFLVVLIFSGCSISESNDDIKLKCEEQGKVYRTKDQLNLRTGEYEKTGYCY